MNGANLSLPEPIELVALDLIPAPAFPLSEIDFAQAAINQDLWCKRFGKLPRAP